MKATAVRSDLWWLVAQTEASGEINALSLAIFVGHLPVSPETRQAIIANAPAPTGNAVTSNTLARQPEYVIPRFFLSHRSQGSRP